MPMEYSYIPSTDKRWDMLIWTLTSNHSQPKAYCYQQTQENMVLLLATMSSTSSGVVGFERKRLASIWCDRAGPSILEFFENCEEQMITII